MPPKMPMATNAPPTAIPMMAPRGRPGEDDSEVGGTLIESSSIKSVASLKVEASLALRSVRTLAAKVPAEALRVAPIAEAEDTLSVVIFVVTSKFALASRLAV